MFDLDKFCTYSMFNIFHILRFLMIYVQNCLTGCSFWMYTFVNGSKAG